MVKVESIFPANDFSVVAENAAKEIDVGLIIGYSPDGELCVYGGGLLHGRQPVSKDWLWLVETLKFKMLNGDYDAT